MRANSRKEPDLLDAALTLACRLQAYDKCAGHVERSSSSDAEFANVKLKYVKSAGVHDKMTTQLRDDTDERNSDAVSKQLVALQQAVERCHVELKSQREEMRAQRSEIESIRFRAG